MHQSLPAGNQGFFLLNGVTIIFALPGRTKTIYARAAIVTITRATNSFHTPTNTR